jgi:hypothetical protein
MGLKVTNNAFGTLNAGINSSATTIVLTAGQGARFPTLSAGDYFYATLIDTSNNLEIVKVTARSTDTMTVVRGQDNTTARAYSTNDRFELRPTAALFNEKADAADVTAGLATKQAASPVLTTYINTGVNFRNRIINGAMMIDQRNAGASVTINGNAPYVLDRYFAQDDTDGSFTVQRSSVSPTGFINSMLVTVASTDTSLGATQLARVTQRIEGFNVADLGWGTANAQTVTLSFWVRSSVTGTFGGSLVNGAVNRSYPFTYTINSANTWELETITIPGDTTGTWLRDSGIGIEINFGLAVGSTYLGTAGAWAGSLRFGPTGASNLLATSGATFYITGVQLEKGTAASPFENRLYTTELQLCERYFQLLSPVSVMLPWSSGSQIVRISNSFKTTMRASPTITMGTKGGGTGTMGTASVNTSGATYFGSGGLGDVIEYNNPTAEVEL